MIEFVFLGLFFALLGVLLYGEAIESSTIRYICMLTLMPLLIAYYLLSVQPSDFNLFIVLALIFGYGGDILLMFHKDELFVFGLLSFLIGHIFYIIAFLITVPNLLAFPVWGLLFVIPSLVIVGYVLRKTIDKMGELKVPTLVYVGVIFSMGFVSILRLAAFTGLSFYLVWLGGVSFMASDGMIAIVTFDERFKNDEVYIKLTYVLAQFLIVLGVLLI